MKVQFHLHVHINYDGNAYNITVNNKEKDFFFAVAMIAKLALKMNRDRNDVTDARHNHATPFLTMDLAIALGVSVTADQGGFCCFCSLATDRIGIWWRLTPLWLSCLCFLLNIPAMNMSWRKQYSFIKKSSRTSPKK